MSGVDAGDACVEGRGRLAGPTSRPARRHRGRRPNRACGTCRPPSSATCWAASRLHALSGRYDDVWLVVSSGGAESPHDSQEFDRPTAGMQRPASATLWPMADVWVCASSITGHVAPMLAIASHLRDAGHAVRMITGSRFGDRVSATGVEILPLRGAADIDDTNLDLAFPDASRPPGSPRSSSTCPTSSSPPCGRSGTFCPPSWNAGPATLCSTRPRSPASRRCSPAPLPGHR